MKKFIKSYYYALLPIMLVLVFLSISYLTGYGGNFPKERVTILLIGGIIVSCFGLLVEKLVAKTKLNQATIIGIVSINILFWVVICFMGLGPGFIWESPPFSTEDGNYMPTFLWATFLNILIFYGNPLWLHPAKKQKKLIFPYWGMVMIILLLITLLESIGDLVLAKQMDLMPKLYDNFGGKVSNSLIILVFIRDRIVINFVFFILSFSNVFYFESLQNEGIKKALEQEKLKAELKFLKAQINPHFLFNGINSVFFLIDDKPDIAKSTLLKFSDLLRYQLYECQDDFIPLRKELDHIKAYVDMEKIRKGEDATIQLSLPNTIGPENISPLLFIPFLENAFKYVSNKDDGQKNEIDISFRLQEGQLNFEIENTVDQNKPSSDGGIGIANVKKRLALLYPKKHHLDIFEKENRYIVRLNLVLNEQ